MGISLPGSLYRLAKRLNVGRILRYGDLWARYLWRRALSRLDAYRGTAAQGDVAAQAAALAEADMATAKRMAVASWFPLDRANVRLHRAMLESVAAGHPDIDISPEALDLPGATEDRGGPLGRRR